MRRRAGLCLLIVSAVIAGAVALVLWARDALNPYNDAPFDQPTWLAWANKAEPRSPRGQMVDDLRKNRLTMGMTRQQVIALLGKPDAGGHPSDAPPSPAGGRLYSYALGHWHCPFCEDTLDLRFGPGGKLTAIGVVTH